MSGAHLSDRPRFRIGWYNGWSPEERMAIIPLQREALRAGRLVYPTACSICGARAIRGSDNPAWYHNEDYADPLAVYAICRGCHWTLHERFDHPAGWSALVATHATGERWFEQLTMNAVSLRQPFATTYPVGIPPY